MTKLLMKMKNSNILSNKQTLILHEQFELYKTHKVIEIMKNLKKCMILFWNYYSFRIIINLDNIKSFP